MKWLFLWALILNMAYAKDRSFSLAEVRCEFTEHVEGFGDIKYALHVLADSQFNKDMHVAVISKLSEKGDDFPSAHIGKIVINWEKYPIKGTFKSISKDTKLELTFAMKGKAYLHLQEFYNGKWYDSFNGELSCGMIQYGSEGVHN